MNDTILFKNGTLIDGTGSDPVKADILVCGTKIADIIPSSEINEPQYSQNGQKPTIEIDISGLVICPGFMDIHAHSELEVLRDPSMKHKISQGITFDLSGNCGVGVYPRAMEDSPCYPDILGQHDKWNWTDYSTYVNQVKSGINMGFLQPHANLRTSVISGNPNRAATKEEVSKMCELLDISLQQGCIGFSTGIYYAPNIFANQYEYIELLKTVKKHDGIFTVHHRCEGTEIISSIEEILSYVRETGVKLQISHLKVIGKNNQEKIDTVLEMIHKAKNEGIDIGFDQYPYEYGSTSLFSTLPPDYLRLSQSDLLATLKRALTDKSLYNDIVNQMKNPEGWDSITELCGFENITAVILANSPDFSGLTLSECAEKLKIDPYSALFYLLSKETNVALMADITQTRDTLVKVLKDDLMCFGTDALYAGNTAHPRSGNAAIHLLTENCIKTDTLSFQQAINKMTLKVAQRLGIQNRGIVKRGAFADLVVFNPKTLKDNSDITKPFEMCTGLEYVLVNGTFALKNGKLTGSLSGQIEQLSKS